MPESNRHHIFMQEAIVRTATTTLSLIEGEQVNQPDDLTVNGKPILIVKGGNTQHLVNTIYKEEGYIVL